MKTKFIIGLGQKKAEFRSLSKYLDIVQPDWNNGSLAKMKLGKPKILIGFSLGCMIAVMHAEKHPVDTLILCSPTYEDLSKIQAKRVIILMGRGEKFILNYLKFMIKDLKCDYEVHMVEAGHKINRLYQNKLLELIK